MQIFKICKQTEKYADYAAIPLFLSPGLPWGGGAHSCLRWFIWLVVICTFAASQANHAFFLGLPLAMFLKSAAQEFIWRVGNSLGKLCGIIDLSCSNENHLKFWKVVNSKTEVSEYCLLDQILIRIIFGIRILTEYEYEYYLFCIMRLKASTDLEFFLQKNVTFILSSCIEVPADQNDTENALRHYC